MCAKRKGAKRRGPSRSFVVGLRGSKDRDQALETLARSFGGLARWEDHMLEALWAGELFDPEHTRLCVAPERRGAGRRVASVVVMAPRTIRIGAARVPAMTVGPVGTHDRLRGRGYSRAAMEDASRHMREHGYLLAYLQGIPDYYYRYGYYPYAAQSCVKFSRGYAAREARPGRLRAIRRGDLPAVARVYESATAARSCAAVRDRSLWTWLFERARKTWLFRNPRVLVDGRRRVAGYLCADDGPGLQVREIVVRQDEGACRAALCALVREAKRRELGEVELPLPHDDALAVFIRQHVRAEFRAQSHPTGGWLMKVVDFAGLMRRLEPAFAERLRSSGRGFGKRRFNIRTDGAAVGIAVRGSRLAVEPPGAGRRAEVSLPARWLPGLVTGYHPVESVAPRRGARVPEDLAPVLSAMFPPARPFVYQADNY